MNSVQRFPITLQDWEVVLTRALLRADGGNSDPIRSFEITPETLAEMCGMGMQHAAAAEDAFRSALRADAHLTWCLKNGTWRTPGNELPHCIAMLSLSLLVDSLLDGDYSDNGQYRSKLAQWLGMNLSFMDLRGIATMWEELVAWLDLRVESGGPFRRLILPKIPRTWTHIGYTRYLSFPTKRDVNFLRRQIERNKRSANDPVAIVTILDPIVRSTAVSYGLKIAFQDFRLALRSGNASTDHRFWRLLSRAKDLAGATQPPLGILRMEFDEDGQRSYRVRSDGASTSSIAADVGKAVKAPALIESPNLGPSIRRGILFFRPVGMASWAAAGEPPTSGGSYHVAVAEMHARLAAGSTATFEQSGAWIVTKEPASAATIADLLKRLRITHVKETVRTVGLVDGVRIGISWLGAPRYLPHLEGAVGTVEIRSTSSVPSDGLAWASGQLVADCPVEGEFTLEDRSAGWSRRANFVARAEVHPPMTGSSYAFDLLREWKTTTSPDTLVVKSAETVWMDDAYAFQDMLEALYASSRSGIREGDAIDLVSRAAGRRSWDMLRTLQEATFIEARLRPRWRGRVFTLGRPHLRAVLIDRKIGVVVSGAIPARLEEDFRATVLLHGGSAFRHVSEGSMAPPLLGAVDMSPQDIADALGWDLDVGCQLPNVGMAGVISSIITGESYLPASGWDWSLNRFRAGAEGSPPAALVRIVHPGGRDHDLYEVDGRDGRRFLSRHAGIIAAHSEAGRPLFRYEGDRLRRLSVEGALPIEVAHALRLRSLRNGGAGDSGWEYEVSRSDLLWLRDLLPGLIEGLLANRSADPSQPCRRGRGMRRPVWINGNLAA